jgi:type IV secretion system protein VirB2
VRKLLESRRQRVRKLRKWPRIFPQILVDNSNRLALALQPERDDALGIATMCKWLSRGLSAATALCGLIIASPAWAGGAGMPWEGPLEQIVESLTGPVVQAAAVFAVCIFGGGIALSENGSALRRGVGILFGLSIAFAASTFFLDFFGFAGGAEIG